MTNISKRKFGWLLGITALMVGGFFVSTAKASAIEPPMIVDVVAPTLDVTGFTANGNPMQLVDGAYLLGTDGNAKTQYSVQFASAVASEYLQTEDVALKLQPVEGQTAILNNYYSTNYSAIYENYLKGAAEGTNAFAYIKTNSTTAQLLDGAQKFLNVGEVSMVIPGDCPAGNYTVSGIIHDLAGNPTTVTYTLKVVAPDFTNVYVSANGNDSGNGTAIFPFATIQKGISAVANGGVVKVMPGNYNIAKDDKTLVSGQTGWYLAIEKSDISLVGVDGSGAEITSASNVMTNIYSTQETANGAWASQNLITVFGNNVTFKGLGIMNKISPNKGIEVLGNNFKAENCVFMPISATLMPTVVAYHDITDNSDNNDISKYGSGVYFNNNGATEARTATITNNIFKNSGITFDSFKDNWTVAINHNIFDGNKSWGWLDGQGVAQAAYYSAIGATTWANQPDFTGSVLNINNNQFVNMVSGKVIVKIQYGGNKEAMVGTFDAKNNWWGTADEATIKTKVLGNVVYNPWYTTEAMTTLAQPLTTTTTVSTETSEVVVDSGDTTESEINIPEGVTNATINVASLLTQGEGEGASDTVVLLATLNIKSNTSIGEVEVVLPAGIEIKSNASDNWNGVINAPQIKLNSSVTPTADTNKTATVSSVVEVGYGDTKLVFNKAVRIIIAGQAGKEVGYSRAGVFTKITTACTADTQVAGDALPAEGDCAISVGSDLVIWTKHFTSFVTYSQTTNPPTGGSGGGSIATASACVSVEYSAWGTCVNKMQYRNYTAYSPAGCQPTVAQQEAGKQACGSEVKEIVVPTKPEVKQEVKGAKVYGEGTLLKGSTPEVYRLVNGKLVYIKTMKEVNSFKNRTIITISDAEAKKMGLPVVPKVVVVSLKKLANGTLVKGTGPKIYRIVNGKVVHIKSLKEMLKYKKPVLTVKDTDLK